MKCKASNEQQTIKALIKTKRLILLGPANMQNSRGEARCANCEHSEASSLNCTVSGSTQKRIYTSAFKFHY